MDGDKYIVYCPRCGPVEACASDAWDDASDVPGEIDVEIEEQVVETEHGPEPRIRCPRCGMWLASGLARPEE